MMAWTATAATRGYGRKQGKRRGDRHRP